MSRVAPLVNQKLILFNALKVQERIAKNEQALASGKVAENYAGVATKSSRLLSLETSIRATERFQENIDLVDRRIGMTESALNTVDAVARQIRDSVTTFLSSPDTLIENVGDFARNARNAVMAALNVSDGSRFLMGGGRIDRAPVSFDEGSFTPVRFLSDDAATVDGAFYATYKQEVEGVNPPLPAGSFYEQIFLDKNGVAPDPALLPADPSAPTVAEFAAQDPDLFQYYVDRLDSPEMLANPLDEYYRGDTVDPSLRIDRDLSISYGIRADEPAVQQLLTALDALANLPVNAVGTGLEKTVLGKVRAMTDRVLADNQADGFTSLNELRVKLDAPLDTIRIIKTRHTQLANFALTRIQDIENVDPAEVIAAMEQDRFVLEASFSVLARVQSITLLNFL